MSDIHKSMELLDADHIMRHVTKKYRLSGSTVDPEARRKSVVSSGLLSVDMLLGGGVLPGGWYTFLGPEQSAKSTMVNSIMTSLAKNSDVPLILFFDAEGSNSLDYFSSIAKTLHKKGLDTQATFGVKDDKGEWAIKPRLHYYAESIAETIWNAAGSMLRSLPDKVYDHGQWWLLFPNTKENASRHKGKVDKKASERNGGKLAVPIGDDACMQALIIVDSYPAMLPSSAAEKDDQSLANAARAHSANVPKVKGLLKDKHAAFIGVNQLRNSINLTGYGPKSYEPCGEALKYFSDVRIRLRAESVPHSRTDRFEKESSVLMDGEDTYRYIHLLGAKNKLGTPNLEAHQRIWVADPDGEGRGFCPVWDTYSYLKDTGQLSGTRRKMTISLPGLELPPLRWLDFKALVTLDAKSGQAWCKEHKLSIPRNPRLREKCFAQVKSRKAMDLYFNNLKSGKRAEE